MVEGNPRASTAASSSTTDTSRSRPAEGGSPPSDDPNAAATSTEEYEAMHGEIPMPVASGEGREQSASKRMRIGSQERVTTDAEEAASTEAARVANQRVYISPSPTIEEPALLEEARHYCRHGKRTSPCKPGSRHLRRTLRRTIGRSDDSPKYTTTDFSRSG